MRLMLIASLLALIGLGALVAWFFFFHLTLRVATGRLSLELSLMTGAANLCADVGIVSARGCSTKRRKNRS
jgi:hypothetical protein